jgi:hypothetical protein
VDEVAPDEVGDGAPLAQGDVSGAVGLGAIGDREGLGLEGGGALDPPAALVGEDNSVEALGLGRPVDARAVLEDPPRLALAAGRARRRHDRTPSPGAHRAVRRN